MKPHPLFILEKEASHYECRQWPPEVDDTIGANARTCSGKRCAGWRWRPFIVDDAYIAARAKAAKDLNLKPESDIGPNATKISVQLHANRAKYGLPTDLFEGYCGYAGEPALGLPIKSGAKVQ